ncbi:MFS transporter [Amycolatopsis rubida]|uniref:MFS transporter, putative metabolite:H+ symporter n=1 Tax=Amycolatopsis rubida TaxID=112413 RepID=A0A1I5EEF9_9PSEU|nr:MFS transporter [Amycolatopsis rubida]SFO09847.1 MFS transporter, putative metabolite:H+ symporter [Amycolatopsis rubida]
MTSDHELRAAPSATARDRTFPEVSARIDRLPSSRWHAARRLLLGSVTFIAGFDQLLIAYALPLMRAEWQLGPGELTACVMSGAIGGLIGGPLIGMLADRFGRTRLVLVTTTLTGLSSLLIALSPGVGVFCALRAIQGIGIGGEIRSAAILMAELAGRGKRGRAVLLYELAFPAGLTFAAVASIALPVIGWRPLYLIGAIPLFLIYPIYRLMPESPRWLAVHGQSERALAVVERIERAVAESTGRPLDPPQFDGTAAPTGRARARDLFSRRYLRRSVTTSVMWFGGFFVNYGLTTWLPTIYLNVYHLSLSQALWYTLITSAAGLCGSFAAAAYVDRIGRKKTLLAGFAIGGALLVPLALIAGSGAVQVLIWSTLSAAFIFAANITMYVYSAEVFPARFRAAASSVVGTWSAVGILLGPVVVSGLLGLGATTAVVFGVLALVGLGTAAIALLCEETAGRPLEEAAG